MFGEEHPIITWILAIILTGIGFVCLFGFNPKRRDVNHYQDRTKDDG